MKKELQIGEIVKLRGVQLMVVAQKRNSCKKCYFDGDMSSCNMARTKLGSCFGISRADKQSINYVKVKNNDKGNKTQ
jgi:homoaconitase/3-isopropylmalate dehydratase large subunit